MIFLLLFFSPFQPLSTSTKSCVILSQYLGLFKSQNLLYSGIKSRAMGKVT